MYYVVYRKHKFSNGDSWPWNTYCKGRHELRLFMNKLGDDYEFRVFKEVESLARLNDGGVE